MPKFLPIHTFPQTKRIKDRETKLFADKINQVLTELMRRISLADNISQVKQVEIMVSTNTGGSDGNWVITGTGTSLVIQSRQSGTCVNEFLLEPSA